MTDYSYLFKKIYIEAKYRNHKKVDFILSNLPNKNEIYYIENVYNFIKEQNRIDNPTERSKILFLGGIRGDILQKCPGSFGHICCNYYVINLYIGCPIGCAYCILQSYLNQPFSIIHVDLDNIFESLDKIFQKEKNKLFRIGTGELGGSLAYDNITGFSYDFLNFFKEYKNVIFEFKTKSDNIDKILLYDNGNNNIVVGFSINPDIIIKNDEKYASSIDSRILSIRKLKEKKYKIALHFDPIIYIKNFKKEYSDVIEKIFRVVESEDIAWISLGTFRYTDDLKKCIQNNYPEADILNNEFCLCKDRKFRYFKPIRSLIYKFVVNKLISYDRKLPIYLCMESPKMWKEMNIDSSKCHLNVLFKEYL